MNTAIQFLKDNPIGDMATIGRDNKPQLRPMGNYFERDGNFYFITGADKEVYQELSLNPHAQFCVRSPQMSWLRLAGEVVFINDQTTKQEIFDNSSTVQHQYQTAENPNFKPFYLTKATAVLFQFGQEPQNFTF
ncbi:MAG: pyridoxamine 5'-phosphate oxidase family protein [Enterococcus sp.]